MSSKTEHWRHTNLLEAAPINARLVDPRQHEYRDMLLIAPNHIESGTGRITEEMTAKKQVAISGKYLAKKNSIIYSKIRPYLKKAAIAREDVLCSADMYPLECTEHIIPEFLLSILLSDKFTAFANSCSNRTGIPKINRNELSQYKFRLPTIPEQTTIAALLSTWDVAIEKAEKLIAVKQEQRKGLMQKLLFGKQRFPGFSKPWRQVRLGDIFKQVKRKNSADVSHVLTASGELGLIDQKDYFNRSVSGKSLKGYYHLKHGEFAYNRSAMKGYPYGAIKRLNDYSEGVLSTLYLCFHFSSRNHNSDFFMHYFEAGNLNRQLRSIAQVGARAHGLLNVTGGDFFNLKLQIPGIDEQERIASFLNSCDCEISLLQKSLDAFKEQKRGLMQKLLTGEWRVGEGQARHDDGQARGPAPTGDGG